MGSLPIGADIIVARAYGALTLVKWFRDECWRGDAAASAAYARVGGLLVSVLTI